MRIAILFLLVALFGAGYHIWQLHRMIVLRSQLQDIEIRSLTDQIDGLADQYSPTAEARERIVQSQDRQQRARKSEYEKTAHALNSTATTAIASLLTFQIFLVLGFAAIRPSASVEGDADVEAFISYNHRNVNQAKEIMQELKGRGCTVTLIEQLLDVPDDKELAKKLSEKILGTRVMVVVLTPDSLKSDWVGFERVLGDTRLRKILYVYQDISFWSAILKTHFLPHKSAGFNLVKSLKAQRRYINLDNEDALDLIAAHLRHADQQSGSLMSLKQIAFSFGSIDQMILNAVFNLCENRMLTAGSAGFWKCGMACCMFLQAVFAAIPFYLLLSFGTFLITIYV